MTYTPGLAELRLACAKSNEEICQTLGAALGYPRFGDDQANFPGATAADGVCVGDHVAETLAMEAAAEIARLKAKIIYCQQIIAEYQAAMGFKPPA